MSDEIQIARYSEARRKLLSLKGSDNLAVDSNVQPGITLDDWTLPENRFVQRINRWATRMIPATAAGNFSGVQITPPQTLAGDRLYVLEGMILNLAAPGQVRFGMGPFNVWPSTFAENPLDNRTVTLLNLFTGGNLAAPLTPQYALNFPAGPYVLDRLNCSLFPFIVSNKQSQMAITFNLIHVTANTSLEVTLYGYDRDATESEF
jgi:hypothetical protein